MERAELEALVQATGVAKVHAGRWLLFDPYWSHAQRARHVEILDSVPPADPGAPGWLCIPTGGSSGGLRFARHDEATLSAAVRGFVAHFELGEINAVDVLPPWHVSGLMARVRCAATGGVHLAWDWKRLEQGEFPELDRAKTWVASLVPTQLQRLLAGPAAVTWLRQLKLLFVGGGPVWPELADAAAAVGLPVVLSYGMTETAAMIVAQRPGDFAHGDRSSGVAMPHGRVSVSADGHVVVAGASLMRGYLGGEELGGELTTADLGRTDDEGRLLVAGRDDDVVITGGEKVSLREIEAVLRAWPGWNDLAVVAVPDAEWGEAMAVCYPEIESTMPVADLEARLARHQRPRHWLEFEAGDWPRNAQGKIDRAALRAAVLARIHPSR